MNKKLLPLVLLHITNDTSIEGITRFQKLVFLVQREELHNDLYPFIAGKYGPFSKLLYDDIDQLVENGFINQSIDSTILRDNNDKQIYELTSKGKDVIKNESVTDQSNLFSNQFKNSVEKYNNIPLWELLEYVYDTYPEMAKNSKLNI